MENKFELVEFAGIFYFHVMPFLNLNLRTRHHVTADQSNQLSY